MKILLKIALLVAFIACSNDVFTQNLDWVHGFGGSTLDMAYQITQDDTGNVYAVGNFSDTVDFDPGPGVFNLIGNGTLNIFVSKYDAAGNLIWAINIGGIGNDQAWDVVLDSLGNIYVSGFFQELVDFDPGPGVFHLGGPANGNEPYVMKLSNSGNLIWAISFSGHSGICYELELDAAGDVMALGSFSMNINFGIATFNSVGSSVDIFLVKISPSGNPMWVKQFGGLGIDRAYGMALDSYSNIYFGGSFSNTLDFDPNPGVYNVTPIGSSDAFLCKMDHNGNLDWVKNFGAVGTWAEVNSVANTTVGTPYICGVFIDSIDFDPGIGTQMHHSAGSLEAFVAKYDANGDLVWANGFGGDSVDIAVKIALDNHGHLYTIGTFSRLADLDPGAGVMNFTSRGLYDIFLQKMDTNGILLSAIQYGGRGNDRGLGLYCQGGNVYAGGSFSDTVDFDPGTAVFNLVEAGGRDAWIQKLSFCTQTDTTFAAITCNSFTAPSGAVFTTTGTYTDIITNANGCDSILTIQLTVTTVNNGIVQSGDTLTAIQSGVFYQWVDCDNGFAPINSANAQFFVPAVTGNYAVIVTEMGCSDTSACIPAIVVSRENARSAGIDVFPNPTTGLVFVKVDPRIELADIQVWNSLGTMVMQYKVVDDAPLALHLPTLPGIYNMELIEVNGNRINKKILVR